MVFTIVADVIVQFLLFLISLGFVSLIPIVFNCAKKPKRNVVGKDAAVQMDQLEVLMRFGKEQGTQLGVEQTSVEDVIDRRAHTMPPGMNILQLHIYGELFKLLQEDPELFAEVPHDLHPYCKLLNYISLLYLTPEMLALHGDSIDLEEEIKKCKDFDKKAYLDLLDLIEEYTRNCPQKAEAVRILREAWLAKRCLAQEELGIVYNELGGEVKDQVKLNKEALRKLLDLLVKADLITGEDTEVLTVQASRITDLQAASGGDEKLRFEHFFMLVEPQMIMDQGRIASRRRIEKAPRIQTATVIDAPVQAAQDEGAVIPLRPDVSLDELKREILSAPTSSVPKTTTAVDSPNPEVPSKITQHEGTLWSSKAKSIENRRKVPELQKSPKLESRPNPARDAKKKAIKPNPSNHSSKKSSRKRKKGHSAENRGRGGSKGKKPPTKEKTKHKKNTAATWPKHASPKETNRGVSAKKTVPKKSNKKQIKNKKAISKRTKKSFPGSKSESVSTDSKEMNTLESDRS